MIDKSSAVDTVIAKLKKLPVGQGVDLRTYKRDRSVIIRKTGEDSFEVMQNGFEQARYESTLKKMRKLLKTLLKKEFPRSNKVRLYSLDEA